MHCQGGLRNGDPACQFQKGNSQVKLLYRGRPGVGRLEFKRVAAKKAFEGRKYEKKVFDLVLVVPRGVIETRSTLKSKENVGKLRG